MIATQTPLLAEMNWIVKEDEPCSEHGKFVSEELYWREYYHHPDFNYEWNDGYLEEKPMANYVEATMYAWFLDILRRFLTVEPIARVTLLEIGVYMALPHKTAIRKPDLGVVLNRNQTALGDYDCSYHGTFDLCVESVSRSSHHEIERDTVVKRAEYEAAGVQEYYILDEQGKDMAFLQNIGGIYRPIRPVGGVIQSTVLAGFQFRIEDLYRQPSLIELAMDPVYQKFVIPEYQAERQEKIIAWLYAEQERREKESALLRAKQEYQRAEQQRQRAEQERQRAEQERQRADYERQEKERLLAKLKELGIQLD